MNYSTANLHTNLIAEVPTWELKFGSKTKDALYFNPPPPQTRERIIVQMCTPDDPLVTPFGIRPPFGADKGMAQPGAPHTIDINIEGTPFQTFAEEVDKFVLGKAQWFMEEIKKRPISEEDAKKYYKYGVMTWKRNDFGELDKNYPGKARLKCTADTKVYQVKDRKENGEYELVEASFDDVTPGCRITVSAMLSNVWVKGSDCGVRLTAHAILIMDKLRDTEANKAFDMAYTIVPREPAHQEPLLSQDDNGHPPSVKRQGEDLDTEEPAAKRPRLDDHTLAASVKEEAPNNV